MQFFSFKYRKIMYYTGRLSTLAGMQTRWKDRRQMNSSLFASLLVLEKGKGFGEKGLCAVLTQAGVKLSHLSCRQLLKRVGKDVIFIVKWRFFFFYSSQHPPLTFFPLSVTPSLSLSLSLHIDLLISVLFCQDHMSEGTLSLAMRPQTLISLTITTLSFRVSFLSPGVSQHDSCSLQEQSHAKLSCSALSFPLALCLKEGVSRHIHTLNLSFTKLENYFRMWLGHSAQFSSCFNVLGLGRQHTWRNWQSIWQTAMHKIGFEVVKRSMLICNQVVIQNGFPKVQQDLSLVSGRLYFWFHDEVSLSETHYNTPFTSVKWFALFSDVNSSVDAFIRDWMCWHVQHW